MDGGVNSSRLVLSREEFTSYLHSFQAIKLTIVIEISGQPSLKYLAIVRLPNPFCCIRQLSLWQNLHYILTGVKLITKCWLKCWQKIRLTLERIHLCFTDKHSVSHTWQHKAHDLKQWWLCSYREARLPCFARGLISHWNSQFSESTNESTEALHHSFLIGRFWTKIFTGLSSDLPVYKYIAVVYLWWKYPQRHMYNHAPPTTLSGHVLCFSLPL